MKNQPSSPKSASERTLHPAPPTERNKPVDRVNFEGFATDERDVEVETSRRDGATNAPLSTSDGGVSPPPFQKGSRKPPAP